MVVGVNTKKKKKKEAACDVYYPVESHGKTAIKNCEFSNPNSHPAVIVIFQT
jgi:hypothetical protein